MIHISVRMIGDKRIMSMVKDGRRRYSMKEVTRATASRFADYVYMAMLWRDLSVSILPWVTGNVGWEAWIDEKEE